MLSSLQPGSSDTGQSHTEHRQGHTIEMKYLYVLILFLNLMLNSNSYLIAHIMIFKIVLLVYKNFKLRIDMLGFSTLE